MGHQCISTYAVSQHHPRLLPTIADGQAGCQSGTTIGGSTYVQQALALATNVADWPIL